MSVARAKTFFQELLFGQKKVSCIIKNSILQDSIAGIVRVVAPSLSLRLNPERRRRKKRSFCAVLIYHPYKPLIVNVHYCIVHRLVI